MNVVIHIEKQNSLYMFHCHFNIALQNKIHFKTSLLILFFYNLKIIIFHTSKNIQKRMHDVVHHKTIKRNNMDFTLEEF